jgi:hypothetical protein
MGYRSPMGELGARFALPRIGGAFPETESHSCGFEPRARLVCTGILVTRTKASQLAPVTSVG